MPKRGRVRNSKGDEQEAAAVRELRCDKQSRPGRPKEGEAVRWRERRDRKA